MIRPHLRRGTRPQPGDGDTAGLRGPELSRPQIYLGGGGLSCHSPQYPPMHRQPLFILASIVLLMTYGSSYASAEDCPLQIRCAGFNAKHYTLLQLSLAPGTNPCPGVIVAVEWSEDLVTWREVIPNYFPCVTQEAEVQVVDETDSWKRPRRFYRARAVRACP